MLKKLMCFLLLTVCFLNVVKAQDSVKYRLLISFHSQCCGVPDNAPLISYVKTFKKKNKIKNICYERIGPLGREGEYDMAFPLRELTKKQAALFVKNIKQLLPRLKERGTVDAEENETIISSDLPHIAKKEKITL